MSDEMTFTIKLSEKMARDLVAYYPPDSLRPDKFGSWTQLIAKQINEQLPPPSRMNEPLEFGARVIAHDDQNEMRVAWVRVYGGIVHPDTRAWVHGDEFAKWSELIDPEPYERNDT